MNEIGSMTNAIEGDKDPQPIDGKMVRVRLIIEGDYGIDPSTYSKVLDEDESEVETTVDERKTFTTEDFLKFDLRWIRSGDLTTDELASYFENVKVTLEEVKDGPEQQ